METTHTPGPWTICEHSWSDTSIYTDERQRRISGMSIRNEATEETQSALEAEMGANARLIAAAPELLAALQDVEENISTPDANCSCHLSAPCGDCVDHSHTREILAVVRAAIAKATGKTA